jgi:AcrR family transcriptional regulator
MKQAKTSAGSKLVIGTTRARLLDSAIAVIAERGYSQATTQAVIDHSGFSRGSLLFQFPNRLELMVATAKEALRRTLSEIDQGMAAHSRDARAALVAYPDILWRVQNEAPAIATTEIELASRWDEDLLARLKDVIRDVDAHVASHLVQLADQSELADLVGFKTEIAVLINFTQGLAINARLAPKSEMVATAMAVARQHYLDALQSRLPQT